jgi:hypothetical protein
MQPVITFGGVTGIVVHRREPVLNKHTKQWEVAEPGKYADFVELEANTRRYNTYSDYITEKYGRDRA